MIVLPVAVEWLRCIANTVVLRSHFLASVARRHVTSWRKTLAHVLSSESRQTVRFDALCALLLRLGFIERRPTGSHRVFRRPGIREIVVIQPRRDGTAKPYQVRQLRNLILKYDLSDGLDEEGE